MPTTSATVPPETPGTVSTTPISPPRTTFPATEVSRPPPVGTAAESGSEEGEGCSLIGPSIRAETGPSYQSTSDILHFLFRLHSSLVISEVVSRLRRRSGLNSNESSGPPAVRVQNVYKAFGRRPQNIVQKLKDGATRDELKSQGTAAVIDASFEVPAGEIFVVMGLSGSGKSTLIRTLNGIQPPTAGSVELSGEDITAVSPARLRAIRRENTSMVFQHFALLPHRTVGQNAAYALEVRGVNRSERED